MHFIKILTIIGLMICQSSAFALTFATPKNSDIIGTLQSATVQKGETLGDIGRRFDIGVYEMIEANPNSSISYVFCY